MKTSTNAGQEDILHRYAAKKAIQDLRMGEAIDPALLSCLNSSPLINYGRSEINEADKELLKNTASSKEKELSLRLFALSLILQFKDHPDVKIFLYDLWNIATEDEIKLQLLWILLKCSDLPKEVYDDICRKFPASEGDKWLSLIVGKLGGDDKEKAQVKELMNKYL